MYMYFFFFFFFLLCYVTLMREPQNIAHLSRKDMSIDILIIIIPKGSIYSHTLFH